MNPNRLDQFASVADAPTAIPFVLAPRAYVCRGMNDLSDAGMYARELAMWFAQNGAPADVYVVRGPTSTTRCGYEVVTETCGYTAVFKVAPPQAEDLAAARLTRTPGQDGLTDIEREIIIDSFRNRHVQEHFHASCLHNVLTGVRPRDVDSDLARCAAFLERRVACIYAHERGENTSEKMWQRLLAEYWPERHHERLLKLTGGYIQARYLDLNQPIRELHSRSNETRPPLEIAIRKGYSRLVAALIEAGADISQIPSSPQQRTPDGPVLAQPGAILDYIASQTHTDVDGMLATAKAALMRRAMAEVEAPTDASRPTRRMRAL